MPQSQYVKTVCIQCDILKTFHFLPWFYEEMVSGQNWAVCHTTRNRYDYNLSRKLARGGMPSFKPLHLCISA